MEGHEQERLWPSFYIGGDMQPVSPVLGEEFASLEVVYAKDQPEYKPLPVIRNGAGIVMSRWKLTDAEREAIANGADLFLSVWTYNNPLQPWLLEVGDCQRTIVEKATYMG